MMFLVLDVISWCMRKGKEKMETPTSSSVVLAGCIQYIWFIIWHNEPTLVKSLTSKISCSRLRPLCLILINSNTNLKTLSSEWYRRRT